MMFDLRELLDMDDSGRSSALRVMSEELSSICADVSQRSGRSVGVDRIIALLREHGYELYSFDEGDGWSTWCKSWGGGSESEGGLIVTIDDEGGVGVEWDSCGGSGSGRGCE